MLPDIAHTQPGAGTKQLTCFGPWPSKSPDMNQIENLWAQLQRAIDNIPNRPQMRHNSEELFKKNGETSTCGIIGSYFFRCSVDAQHLCRLQGDIQNIENAFCYISVILWKHIELGFLFSNKYLISFNNQNFRFLLFLFL